MLSRNEDFSEITSDTNVSVIIDENCDQSIGRPDTRSHSTGRKDSEDSINLATFKPTSFYGRKRAKPELKENEIPSLVINDSSLIQTYDNEPYIPEMIVYS